MSTVHDPQPSNPNDPRRRSEEEAEPVEPGTTDVPDGGDVESPDEDDGRS